MARSLKTAVVVPWRNAPDRLPLWSFVKRRLEEQYPQWPVIETDCSPGPFSRAECIVRGAQAADADVVVVTDADVILHGDLSDSVAAVMAGPAAWAVPHWHLRRLTAEASHAVMAGAPLSERLPLAEKAYKGNATGTLVVLRTDLLFAVPPDVRFRGWGQEDEAWAAALRLLAGEPWRGAADLFHLWHPPAERMSRVEGNPEGVRLRHRYDRVARSRPMMQALVDESKSAWVW